MTIDATDSPFYRVSVKTIILDDAQRLLVAQTEDGLWEIPGGGWEHDEPLESCVAREIAEELGVQIASIGPIQFIYRGTNPRGYQALRLAVPVTLQSSQFTPGDDMIAAKYISKDELLALPMQPDEAIIRDYVDIIWPPAARAA